MGTYISDKTETCFDEYSLIEKAEDGYKISVYSFKLHTGNPYQPHISESYSGDIFISYLYYGNDSYYERRRQEYRKYLSLKEQGIKGLVIDLRDNGGGLVAEALKIVDYIVPKDQTALITVDKDGKEEISKTKEDAIITEPIVLLVNSSSASASEIMAGALKDLKCATIVGTKTYGKGVIQQLLTLSNGAGLKITVEEYYTPNKTKINKVGITPDYEILLETSITREPTDANDTQLNKAKEILKAKIEN